MSPEQRFFAKVDVGNSPAGCWMWTGCTNADGYGRFRHNGRTANAHRAGYELFVGPVADDHDVDHLCRERGCVNPLHLEPVDRAENVRRGRTLAVRTHCREGHEYTEDNTLLTKDARVCRTCKRAYERARYAEAVAA